MKHRDYIIGIPMPERHRKRRRDLGQKQRKYFQQNHRTNFPKSEEKDAYTGPRVKQNKNIQGQKRNSSYIHNNNHIR